MAKYGTNREDLLGGLVGALSKGRVNKVRVSASANTGMTAYSRETGKAQHIILPREDRLPKGCTMEAAKGLLDHETGHALFTELTPELAQRTGLVQEIANILEDPREEKLMMNEYEGSKENIGALSALGLSIIRENAPKMDPLRLALAGLSLLGYGHDPRVEYSGLPLAPEVMPFLDAAAPLVAQAVAAPDTAGVFDMADRIMALLHTPKPKPQPSEAPEGQGEDGAPEDQDEAEGQDGEGSSSSAAPEGAEKGDQQQKPKGTSGKAPKEPQDEAEGQEGSEGSAKGEAGESRDEDAGEPAEGDSTSSPDEGEGAPAGQGAGEGESQPEGSEEPQETELSKAVKEHGHGPCNAKISPADLVAELLAEAIEEARKEVEKAEAKALLEAAKSGLMVPFDSNPKAWKGMEEEERLSGDSLAYDILVAQMKPVIAAVRHELRTKLMAENRTRIRRGQEEGDLDSASLFQIPARTSTKVFQNTTKGKSTRVAVTLLVDNSGSMGGSKVVEATKAATALNEALSRLPGITTEVLGFTFGRTCVHRIAKPFGSRDASGITGFYAGGGNADGCAVRWAARRSLAQKADRRILIVLSDGRPTNGASDPSKDLRAAVEAATRHGVETFGIGIMDQSVAAFYPKFVVIQDARDLTGTVLKTLGSLIGNRNAKAPKVA